MGNKKKINFIKYRYQMQRPLLILQDTRTDISIPIKSIEKEEGDYILIDMEDFRYPRDFYLRNDVRIIKTKDDETIKTIVSPYFQYDLVPDERKISNIVKHELHKFVSLKRCLNLVRKFNKNG